MYKVDTIETILMVPSIEEAAGWYKRILGWEGHYDTFDEEGNCTFGSVAPRGDEAESGQGDFIGFNLERSGSKLYSNTPTTSPPTYQWTTWMRSTN